MLHDLITTWFTWVQDWGYWGIIVLMAMESSIFPVPSELVIPPAAFWAAQGKLNVWGVILAGTVGSYLGSAITYFASLWLGRAAIARWGKLILITSDKVEMAERWTRDYGMAGVFYARLLPVVRHLISIPAGILRMPFWGFSVVTTVGAGIWCSVLAWFGMKVLGEEPRLLESPEAMIGAMKAKVSYIVGAIFLMGILYFVVKARSRPKAATQI